MGVYRSDPPVRAPAAWLAPFLTLPAAPPLVLWIQNPAAYWRDPTDLYFTPVRLPPPAAVTVPPATLARIPDSREYSRAPYLEAQPWPVAPTFAPADPVYVFAGQPAPSPAALQREQRAPTWVGTTFPPPAPPASIPPGFLARFDVREQRAAAVVPAFAIQAAPVTVPPAQTVRADVREQHQAPAAPPALAALLATPSPIYVFRGPLLQPAAAYAREPWRMPAIFLSAGAALFGGSAPQATARLAAYQRPRQDVARPTSFASSRPGSANSRRG